MGGNKAVTFAIGAVTIGAVVALGIIAWYQLKPAPNDGGIPPLGVGEPMVPPQLICDDGPQPIFMPPSLSRSMKGPDGQDDPDKWEVPAYKGKTFYRAYRCLTTNKIWAYGKNGQYRSPYVGATASR